MNIEVDEIQKLAVKEDEILFIKMAGSSTQEEGEALAKSLQSLKLTNRKIIIHVSPLDLKTMTRDEAQALRDELKRVLG